MHLDTNKKIRLEIATDEKKCAQRVGDVGSHIKNTKYLKSHEKFKLLNL